MAYEDDASSQEDGSASSQDEVLACILQSLLSGADPDRNLLRALLSHLSIPFLVSAAVPVSGYA